MTLSKVTFFSLLAFSQISSAQLVNTDGIVNQVGQLPVIIEPISDRLTEPKIEPPFALSSLPPIKDVITKPLNQLPKILPIGTDISKPVLIEVEVEDGWRAVKNQWMVLADAKSEQALIKLGATIESSKVYQGLGLSLLHFTVPETFDGKSLLAQHLTEKSLATLDRNHIYQAQNTPTDTDTVPDTSQASVCDTAVNIGMIDSAINQQHRAFKAAHITAKSFLVAGLTSPSHHGTAVASVLVGEAEQLSPLLPNAQLYSAEVFYQQSNYTQGATLSAMIEALNWLVEQKVAVINMSLAGPDNNILQRVISAATDKGAFIVAAAGNEGPAATPVFPAGYAEVTAVSAIDASNQPYRWSNRGDYIDYAALGVNVLTAQAKQGLGKESGTSMAAPVVSAALACLLAKQSTSEGLKREGVLTNLSKQAVDMGPKGRDPIYGYGAINRHQKE
ncbi:S8 family serine peptidase [uncultured Paraglaciecola sp.]|uniref:S8 family serine peptidase n=1 Tax=uncultured Paraglaciecola sp. TaxID=1765024 RepID=UPI0030D84DD1|tara:strand:- start:42431 stop:43771 length:1341 start_codon:yes stop_codon:yes gene_type:complete